MWKGGTVFLKMFKKVWIITNVFTLLLHNCHCAGTYRYKILISCAQSCINIAEKSGPWPQSIQCPDTGEVMSNTDVKGIIGNPLTWHLDPSSLLSLIREASQKNVERQSDDEVQWELPLSWHGPWRCFCSSQEAIGLSPYLSFSSCFLMCLLCSHMKLNKNDKISARLNVSVMKQGLFNAQASGSFQTIHFLLPYLQAASSLWGKESRICSNQSTLQLAGCLWKNISTFPGCILPPGVEGSSLPTHSTSLARHIALVKRCSTQCDKYPY